VHRFAGFGILLAPIRSGLLRGEGIISGRVIFFWPFLLLLMFALLESIVIRSFVRRRAVSFCFIAGAAKLGQGKLFIK